MKRILLILLFLLLQNCIYRVKPGAQNSLASGPTQPLIIKNISLFAGPANSKVQQKINIYINQKKITRISREFQPNKAARVIDGSGLMALPGFIDLHTHIANSATPPWMIALSSASNNFNSFAYTGVTTVFDIFGNVEEHQAAREAAGDNPDWPDFFTVGRGFTTEGGHPAFAIEANVPWGLRSYIKNKMVYEVDADTDYAALLKENKKLGATGTKVFVDQLPLDVPVISQGRLTALVTEAQKQGLPVLAHVGSEEDIKKAMTAGVRIFVHGPYKGRISDTLIKEMVKKEVTMMPTAILFKSVALLADKKFELNAFDRQLLDKKILEAFNDPEGNIDPRFKPWFDLVKARLPDLYDNIKRMHRAGVNLVAASDSPTVGLPAGNAVIKEAQLWVKECGIKPETALAAATYVPGQLLERVFHKPGFGHLAPGKTANLVLVEGDFRNDMKALDQVRHVIIRGRLLERKLAQP